MVIKVNIITVKVFLSLFVIGYPFRLSGFERRAAASPITPPGYSISIIYLYLFVKGPYLLKFSVLIRKTEKKDLPLAEDIYRAARAFMKSVGNGGQWGEEYPKREKLLEDISRGYSYLCVEGDSVLAVFSFCPSPDPTYERIENGAWLNEEPYFVIHRMAAAKRRSGAASFCFAWCFKRCSNIRVDTHKDNAPMLGLIKKFGFKYCGIIYTDDGSPRLAFQKKL